MFPAIEFPDVVERYAPHFQHVFSDEAYVEFKRYISGLIVGENKTVEGINRLMLVESRNQSSLNRMLTESPYSLNEVNEARLRMLASLSGTQMKPRGVLSIDDTLLAHFGRKFEHIAKLLGVWKRRRKRYPQIHKLYATKLDMAQHFLQQWVATHPETKLPVTFDSWYTQPDFCRFLDQELHLPYVGTLEEKDVLVLKDGEQTVGEFAALLKKEHLQADDEGGKPLFQPLTISYKGKREQYYSYCRTHRVRN